MYRIGFPIHISSTSPIRQHSRNPTHRAYLQLALVIFYSLLQCGDRCCRCCRSCICVFWCECVKLMLDPKSYVSHCCHVFCLVLSTSSTLGYACSGCCCCRCHLLFVVDVFAADEFVSTCVCMWIFVAFLWAKPTILLLMFSCTGVELCAKNGTALIVLFRAIFKF